MPNLMTEYKQRILPELKEALGLDNVTQVPKLCKVTLNMGLGRVSNEKGAIEAAVKDLTRIAGQKSVITKASKSIANFKVREGWPVGCMVTLRREKMYYLMERLISVAIPRVRDFRGLPRGGFDGYGNYNMGIKEHIIFPEIDYDQIDRIRGMDIAITTSATNDEHAYALLKAFRFPLRS